MKSLLYNGNIQVINLISNLAINNLNKYVCLFLIDFELYYYRIIHNSNLIIDVVPTSLFKRLDAFIFYNKLISLRGKIYVFLCFYIMYRMLVLNVFQ